MSADTLEIIYKTIMSIWCYLPLVAIYNYFIVKKDGRKIFRSKYAERYIEKTQNYYQQKYQLIESKVLKRIESLHEASNLPTRSNDKKTFTIKAFGKKIYDSAS